MFKATVYKLLCQLLVLGRADGAFDIMTGLIFEIHISIFTEEGTKLREIRLHGHGNVTEERM